MNSAGSVTASAGRRPRPSPTGASTQWNVHDARHWACRCQTHAGPEHDRALRVWQTVVKAKRADPGEQGFPCLPT
jgi:hypothetical protein